MDEELEGLDDIREMDADLTGYDDEITAAMVAFNSRLLDALRDLLDRLELKGRATTAEQVKANLRIVTMWRADLAGLLDQLGFTALADSLISKMISSSIRINAYYSLVQPGFAGGEYSELVTSLTTQTRAVLTSTVIGTYGPVIDDVLTWGILTKSTGAEMRTAIVAKLPGEGAAVRHVGQVASDTLYTFSRGYAQAVAEGLNLKHYYYMGTQIATTRSFCSERFGKAFTQAEIESWADLTWSGKIPGTTKQTVFWYAGGFRCRHRILPISKRLYNQFLLNNN